MIEKKLTTKLAPSQLEVLDVSGGCGAMFRVKVTSSAFSGVPLLAQHRMVYDILSEEMKSMHALHLDTAAPAADKKERLEL